MEYASFGSISSGTMRTEDLLDSFAWELESLVQGNAEEWCSDAGRTERDALLALVWEARECDVDADPENADDIVQELFDALQQFAPPYAYFGSHPEDGADYGFWLSESFEREFDGLKVSDTSEIPADYSGEVLHVNDHGNLTLYVCNAGEMTEVWGIV
jgi:hypothetical protein